MERTDTASRLIATEPDRAYAALVDPEALATWLPPTGMTGRFERFDPRPGGGYRMVLTYTDPDADSGKSSAGSDVLEARFDDVVMRRDRSRITMTEPGGSDWRRSTSRNSGGYRPPTRR